jgi:lysophospholipase L1-like esterase
LIRVLGRLVLVVAGLTVGLAAAEFGFRLLPRAASPHDVRALHELRPDRPWLYGMRPGAEMTGPGGVRYVVNPDGFRDRRYARPKPAGTFRIVVLGHSTAFGWGVVAEDTFPKWLERRLTALVPGAEVLNLGISGYNPYTETALLADVGVSYEPDLVLVEFGINDLNDPTLHFDSQTTRRLGSIPDAAFPNPTQRRPVPPPPSLAERVCGWSQLCTMVADRFAPLPDAALLRATLVPHDDPSDAELAWLRARYEDMRRTAAGVGARFAVVVIPYATQLTGQASDRSQQRIAALGREAEIVVVDVLPAFREAARSGTPLFLDLWHPTPLGHQVVADTLLAALRCRGLLPLSPPSDCDAAPMENHQLGDGDDGHTKGQSDEHPRER